MLNHLKNEYFLKNKKFDHFILLLLFVFVTLEFNYKSFLMNIKLFELHLFDYDKFVQNNFNLGFLLLVGVILRNIYDKKYINKMHEKSLFDHIDDYIINVVFMLIGWLFAGIIISIIMNENLYYNSNAFIVLSYFNSIILLEHLYYIIIIHLNNNRVNKN